MFYAYLQDKILFSNPSKALYHNGISLTNSLIKFKFWSGKKEKRTGLLPTLIFELNQMT